jgi:hypothetical protein
VKNKRNRLKRLYYYYKRKLKKYMNINMILLLGVLLIITGTVPMDSVKIGIICETNPASWQYLFSVGSAIQIAIDRLKLDNVLQPNDVR